MPMSRPRPTLPATPERRRPTATAGGGVVLAALLAALAGCGGGGPLSNPQTVFNPPGSGGQKLSFAYFQRCVNPIFLAQLQINQNGVLSVNSCAGAGCHDDASGTGGAFRVRPAAAPVDLANAANTADVIRQSDMYKNFFSSQGEVVFNAPMSSRLLTKPLVQGVLHGGGLIFLNDQDPNVRVIRYWISRPMPQGQDEFSAAANSMFTPPDPATGACNTE
jgi:acyl-coenzyme A thioesterase PaaI-like protein